MSSSQQPIYWDSAEQALAATTAYKVNLPIGTTDWTVYNGSGGTVGIAGTAATIAASHLAVRNDDAVSGKGQDLYLVNGTGGALTIQVSWIRAGRQPTSDAGTTTFTAL
jgi:hypothetical protein